MTSLNLLGIAISLLVGFSAQAYDLRTQLFEQKNRLSVSLETSSFRLDEGEINGTGGRIDFSHSFSKKWSMDLSLSTALNGQGSLQSAFTGFSGYAYFNLFSDCCGQERTTLLNGHTLVNEVDSQPQSFQIGLGLEQFLLNGSRGVYSFSGPGVGTNYQVNIGSFRLKVSGRYSEMETPQSKVKAMLIGVGLVFPM